MKPKFWVVTTDTDTRRYLVEADSKAEAMEVCGTGEGREGLPMEWLDGDFTVDACVRAADDASVPE